MAKSLRGKLHYHSCAGCRERYPDACVDQATNGTCPSCRTGRPSVVMRGQEPHDCCRTDLRVANKSDLETYKLRGQGPWWLCKTCARQFGFDVRLGHD